MSAVPATGAEAVAEWPSSGARAPLVDEVRLALLLEKLAGEDLRGALAAATESVVELLGEWGACVLLEPSPHFALATDDPGAPARPLSLENYPEVTAALASGEVVVIEDTRSSPLLANVRAVLPPRIGAIAVVPLLAGRRAVGALVARSRRPRAMAPADVATARLLGIAVALLVAALAPKPALALGGPILRATATPVMGTPLPRRSRRRILLAEDDHDQGRTLAAALTEEGFEVTVVERGDLALARAKEAPPDLALLDVCLPGMDGFAVANELANDRHTATVPVLLLSAGDELLARVRDCRRGELDFLRKPYRLEELLARVDRCIHEAAMLEHLAHKARLDELTGLGNFRLFEERLAVEESRLRRYQTALTIVIADLDGLKLINDRHGHPVGSAVIQAVGQALRKEIRETDLAARYGGDEFAVLLPHTTLGEGITFCERLLERLRRLRPCNVPVSVSLGVASFDEHADGSVRALLERADQAAYRAKREGGNRLWADGSL